MIKGLISNIKDSGLNEIFWIFIGMLSTKLIEALYNYFREKIVRRKNSKKILGVDSEFIDSNSIIGLTHAYPYYKDNHIKLNNTGIELFFDCPTHIKERILELNPEFIFKEDKSFNRNSTFEDLVSITEIDNLIELINKHKDIVGEKILGKLERNEEIFNSEKFGVHRVSVSKRGKHEDDTIDISFFRTDYYTHMVFRSIYKELIELNHPIKDVMKINELSKYTPFTTSFGVNTYVIIDNNDSNNKNIIFTKRSKYAGIDISESKWHVSMNEGLTITDIDYNNKISINSCLIRGLNEELGIREENSKIKDVRFMDLFLHKGNFEIGITSFVNVEMSFEDLKTKYMSAKDGELESDEIEAVRFNKKDIDKFISKNRGKFTEAGIYVLGMLRSRSDLTSGV